MKQLPTITGIVLLASIAFGHPTYIGYSGAPGSSGTCASSCHGSSGGTIQIEGFPAEYVPGQSYTITISHNGGNEIRQFNGSCRIGTGSSNAGAISAGTNTITYNTSGETNGIHLSSISLDSGSFQWAAPAQGTGDVRLYVAGHQGNYSGANTNIIQVSSEQAIVAMLKAPYIICPGTNTEMEIHWQLDGTANCIIEWGTDLSYSMGTAQTQEYGTDHQHTYTIDNLTPGMIYYFRVITDAGTYPGSFRTAPADNATSTKFFAYGDTRSHPETHDQVAQAMVSRLTDDSTFQSMIIMTGDLVSDGDLESAWDDEFFDPSYSSIQSLLANLPYQAARGNHEGTAVLFEKYFPFPYVDSHYWSFDYGPAHFAVVDQYVAYSTGSAQLQWIENDLAATEKPWKFVILHEPGWSAGGGHENNVDVQDYIQPLCEQYGVAIVFGGHNHYYARAVVNDVQHITTGGGGASLYTPDPGYPNIVATGMYHHFCKVEIDSNQLSFTAITPEGTVIDTFTIIQGSASIMGDNTTSPSKYSLSPAYPNPFNPTTTLSFSLPAAANVTLTVYDITGRCVANLVNGRQDAGIHRITFDGSHLASGIYLVQYLTGDFSQVQQVQKVVLLK
jgi:hypothetical protein